MILNSGMLIPCDVPFKINTESSKNRSVITADPRELGYDLPSYGMPKEVLSQMIKSSSSPSLSKDSAVNSDMDEWSDDSSDSGHYSE